MTRPHGEPLSFADWLDVLVKAEVSEKRHVGLQAIDALDSIALREVRCVLHGQTLTFIGAVRHLIATEPTAGDLVHTPGSLREPLPEDEPAPPPWSTSVCSGKDCKARVIWATKQGGGSVSIDVDPSPSGRVRLIAGASVNDKPIAIFMHTLAEQESQPEGTLRTPHLSNCPNAADFRRPI